MSSKSSLLPHLVSDSAGPLVVWAYHEWRGTEARNSGKKMQSSHSLAFCLWPKKHNKLTKRTNAWTYMKDHYSTLCQCKTNINNLLCHFLHLVHICSHGMFMAHVSKLIPSIPETTTSNTSWQPGTSPKKSNKSFKVPEVFISIRLSDPHH